MKSAARKGVSLLLRRCFRRDFVAASRSVDRGRGETYANRNALAKSLLMFAVNFDMSKAMCPSSRGSLTRRLRWDVCDDELPPPSGCSPRLKGQDLTFRIGGFEFLSRFAGARDQKTKICPKIATAGHPFDVQRTVVPSLLSSCTRRHRRRPPITMDAREDMDTDRMRQLACIATAVMEPAVVHDRRSPTTPADFHHPSIYSRHLTSSLPRFQSLVSPELPSLHSSHHMGLHEKQAAHMLWLAQEQDLARRQRHIIALKERAQAQARHHHASPRTPPKATSSRKSHAPPQHRLQELFTQQQREQDAMRRNLVQLNYHRMLAEEDLVRLHRDERMHVHAKQAFLLAQKSSTFDAAVAHASSPSTDDRRRRGTCASSTTDDDDDNDDKMMATADENTQAHANSILQLMLPPVLPHRVGLNVKDVSLNELRPHFNKPMAAVAKELGVCITLMKKICRKNGLSRWPHRRIRSLVNRITSLQVVAESVDKAEQARFELHIANLRKELSDVIQNPNGKSRKAQEYERRKTDDEDDDDDDEEHGRAVLLPRRRTDDLSCLEELDATPVTSLQRLSAVILAAGGAPGLPSKANHQPPAA
ncbi:Aste57867_10646 [Aphanomyces stellatus]|uniref:Aste57867_10646 protein n=1 Tax=Aphanomyces stellatus TaxID=120398 RepID=A0A485KRZ9_9STRA|nr:hypothetical protein As57867_010606 [Aphanomyces stellatus]VFT87518.1 Aste57867_10646 [Aphanomyces stellatus]